MIVFRSGMRHCGFWSAIVPTCAREYVGTVIASFLDVILVG